MWQGPLPSGTMKKLSIITVAYNEASNLQRLKQSFDEQEVPQGWSIETVLVDNGSSDDSARLAIHLGFTKVVQDGSPTVAGCRNRGAQEATGDILAYVDADCELGEGWVERVIGLLEKEKEMVVGWPVEPPKPMTWVQRAWHAHWVNKRGKIDGLVTGELAMTLITTANMSMTRNVFHLVGGFDETLKSGEDTNFLLRANQKGIKLIAVPALKVVHHGEPRTLAQFYKQQQWHCSKNGFRKILSLCGGRSGGNALWYTVLYTMFVIVALVGCIAAVLGFPKYLLAVIPVCMLLISPSAVIAIRAKRLSLIGQLPVLYFVYGWVRMWNMFGASRDRKHTWK